MALDIIRKRGDTYADEFQIVSDTTGAPIDITGYSFLLTVDPSEYPGDSANNIFQISGQLTDAPNGLVAFAPSAGQADNLGNYFYDIQMTDTGGAVRTIETGRYNLKQDITK